MESGVNSYSFQFCIWQWSVLHSDKYDGGNLTLIILYGVLCEILRASWKQLVEARNLTIIHNSFHWIYD